MSRTVTRWRGRRTVTMSCSTSCPTAGTSSPMSDPPSFRWEMNGSVHLYCTVITGFVCALYCTAIIEFAHLYCNTCTPLVYCTHPYFLQICKRLLDKANDRWRETCYFLSPEGREAVINQEEKLQVWTYFYFRGNSIFKMYFYTFWWVLKVKIIFSLPKTMHHFRTIHYSFSE